MGFQEASKQFGHFKEADHLGLSQKGTPKMLDSIWFSFTPTVPQKADTHTHTHLPKQSPYMKTILSKLSAAKKDIRAAPTHPTRRK